MATLTRSSPNFALPATQNTAPVHEFRCLYTHDVRKKAKKWHDGSARFHTFNRRVMVYDDAKNYIGDQHYRADEEFGEGIELQLDRGVMVEVGERMGTTQTDLTGVIHRSNADTVNTPSASASVQPRPTQRASNLSTQTRPKSLTELLGTTQNRLGRAKLPVTSPFEQRQALAEVQHVERPAKRQKTLSGKENSNSQWRTPDAIRSKKELPSSSITTSSPITSRVHKQQNPTARMTKEPARGLAGVIDISSDEELSRHTNIAARTTRETSKPNGLRERERDTQSRDSKKNDVTPERSVQVPQAPVVPEAPQVPSEVPANSASILTGSNGASKSLLKPGTSSLKMRSQGPRKKLMYKALLPSGQIILEPETTIPIAHHHGKATIPELSPMQGLSQSSDVNVEQLDFEIDELDELPDLNPELNADPDAEPQPAQRTPQKQQTASSSSRPSPMFLSQRASQRSPTPVRDFIEDDFDIPTTQAVPKHVEDPTVEVNENAIRISDDEETPEPDSPYFPLPPSRAKPANTPAPTIMPPPQLPISLPPRSIPQPAVQRTPSPKKNRPFTRSLSEHDSPLPNDPRTSPFPSLLAPVEDSPIISPRQILAPQLAAQKTRNPTPTKSAFQRCRSDTAAIVPTKVLDPEIVSAPTEEQGPWTKLEAFLLFDKWPMCKQKDKPVFEPLSDIEPDDGSSDSESDSGGGGRFVNGFIRPVVGGGKCSLF